MTALAPGYRLVDTLTARTIACLSRVVGVKNITRMFWNRWRASLIGDATIMEFLSEIDSMDQWLEASMRIIDREQEELRRNWQTLSNDEKIFRLRRLSYLAHMAQWGCVRIDDGKRDAYRLSRDYYIRAEELAHGHLYQRVAIRWKGREYWGNLHLPKDRLGPYPLVVIIHGMDDSKEEHLMTELAGQERGAATFCFDGPGQSESLYLHGSIWPLEFDEFVSEAITQLCDNYQCDPERTGVSGLSWGGMWAFKVAARDQRVRAVFDLGGPVEWKNWYAQLPYFLKNRFCQVLGATEIEQIRAGDSVFAIENIQLLDRIKCPVRIVHGGRDFILSQRSKEWLAQTLRGLHPEQVVDLIVHPTGDHCCTGQAAAVRQQAGDFFDSVLQLSGRARHAT